MADAENTFNRLLLHTEHLCKKQIFDERFLRFLNSLDELFDKFIRSSISNPSFNNSALRMYQQRLSNLHNEYNHFKELEAGAGDWELDEDAVASISSDFSPQSSFGSQLENTYFRTPEQQSNTHPIDGGTHSDSSSFTPFPGVEPSVVRVPSAATSLQSRSPLLATAPAHISPARSRPISEAERRRRAHMAAQRQAESRRALFALNSAPPDESVRSRSAATSSSAPIANDELGSAQQPHSFAQSQSHNSEEHTQNRLLDDMFSVASALRAQATASQKIVQGDNKKLDALNSQADNEVNSLREAQAKLNERRRAQSYCDCWICMMLVFVFLVFFFTVLLIKIFPKPRAY